MDKLNTKWIEFSKECLRKAYPVPLSYAESFKHCAELPERMLIAAFDELVKKFPNGGLAINNEAGWFTPEDKVVKMWALFEGRRTKEMLLAGLYGIKAQREITDEEIDMLLKALNPN